MTRATAASAVSPSSPSTRSLQQRLDLLVQLVLRDLKVRYQRSLIGIGWSLLKPLSQLIVFSIVFTRVLPLNIENYTTFVFTGVLAWTWFSGSMTAAVGSVTANKTLAMRPGFPSVLLPTLVVASQGIHFVLALPLLLLCAAIDTGSLALVPLLALPLVVALQALLTLGIAYLLAALHVYFRDAEHLTGIAMMLGFYVTPVFYRPIPAGADLELLTTANPLAWLLRCYREVLVSHHLPPAMTMAELLAVSVLAFGIGLAVFRRAALRFDEAL
ncbi:ABC transporter permease [Novosphingobium huizhouense]|uniref:ABC transporter permease n=1 Tax=Novosphingobium huizhouense TaxID=2866625 RepID=UPI001CD866C7|nr:ABC transporter permease [Novosphingobium huizhouense]